MNDIILCTYSEYTHAKLVSLSKLLSDVDHVHVFGQECVRWEQMIECCLHVMVISYPEVSAQNIPCNKRIVCI